MIDNLRAIEKMQEVLPSDIIARDTLDKRKHKLIIAVIGSRKFNDYKYLHTRTVHIMLGLQARLFDQGVKPDWHIISGGAKGADTLAKQFAEKSTYSFEVYLPDFKKLGTPYHVSDYLKRDIEIAEACHVLIGFLVKIPGENRGSMLTIEAALERQKEVHVFWR